MCRRFRKCCKTQKELEDQFLRALEHQKELWEKFNNDNSRIEEEQKKLFKDFRESTKLNLQSVFGQPTNNVFDQFISQIDVVSNRLQELTLKPYRESLSLFSQSQDQFNNPFKIALNSNKKFVKNLKMKLSPLNKCILTYMKKI